MELVLGLALILIIGYFFGLFAQTMKLPKVSFYLLAGVLFSDDFLGNFLNLHLESWSNIFSALALSFIAYIVGSEINLAKLKKHEKTVLLGVLFETSFAVIMVFVIFTLVGSFLSFPIGLSLALAAIAATTAPAATLAVIEEYNARGEMTADILGIVALDDAVGLLIFSLITSLFFSTASGGMTLFFKDIGLALLVGGCLGIFLKKVSSLAKNNDYLFPLLVGLILLVYYFSHTFHFSSLFACMILGMTANNIRTEESRISLLLPIQHIEDFIFIAFFTLAGAHFSLEKISHAAYFIFFYMIARASGKYIGAFTGTKLAGAKKKTSRWIGLALFPQAGVAVGLVLQTKVFASQPDLQSLLVNIVLGSTILYGFIGSLLAKFALTKVGDISPRRRRS